MRLFEFFNRIDELDLRLTTNKLFQEVETYKNYNIFITKKRFKDRYFITQATYSNGETLKAGGKEVKASGDTRPEAVQAMKDAIDEILNAQKVTTNAVIDFNVEFVKQLMHDPRTPFYAKLDNINGQPVLIMAGNDMLDFGSELAELGFKKSSLRINRQGENDSTPLPAITYTANQIKPVQMINNGRYLIGNSHKDEDGNTVYKLEYHSTVHTSSDKSRLNQPALTVASRR